MTSSVPNSPERRLSAWQRRLLGAVAIGLAWVMAPGTAAPAGGTADPALETCDAGNVDDAVLRLCLEGLAREVAEELERVLDRTAGHFGERDAITGSARASRTLDQAQAAFALFRDLDCHLVEIDQGIGRAAVDRGLACRIDHDRDRIASLMALIGEPEPDGDSRPESEPDPQSDQLSESGPDSGPEAETETEAATEPGPLPLRRPGSEPPAGRALLGTSWRVVQIDGEAAVPEIETTLEIDEAGDVAGIGGCNRYSASVAIGAENGFDIGAIGATRMACDEATMAQETRYFTALEQVAGFSVGADGLMLSDADGNVLVRLERRAD